MAKELLIVFIYDCELCKKEEDDPQDAITYFYPTWVSNEQRHALCSQLMGVTQFCSKVFSLPKIISLQTGKFAVKKLGRYAMCVGTDRNIPDIILETRSKILYRLLRLFHNGIETMCHSAGEDDDSLSDKLTELFQVYLPILQYATNTFGNIPVLKIPKSTSTLFLEAMHTLQGFQEVHGVLGGMLLYQNKVVATQLNCALTKELVATDPYRIKLPAEPVKTTFHLPMGVQLLYVYIQASEITRLNAENNELFTALSDLKNWRKELDAQLNTKNACSKQTDMPVVGGMKRDTSRIFTVVEEDGIISPEGQTDGTGVPDVVKDAVKARCLARLDTLPVRGHVVPTPAESLPAPLTPDDRLSTKKIPIRYYSLGLPKPNSDWCDSADTEVKNHPHYYNTICDPKYPLFKGNGLPASHCLSSSTLISQYDSIKAETDKSTPKKENKEKPRPRSIVLKPSDEGKPPDGKPTKEKRPLSLPLGSSTGSRLGKVTHGVPLTPLMAKLSLLAEEGSIMETPLMTPATAYKPWRDPQPNGKAVNGEKVNSKTLNDENEQLVKTVLYVFGSNNTSVLLLLDPKIAVKPDVIHSLWERSMTSLKQMEERLVKCLAQSSSESGVGTSGEYSYAVVSGEWGPTERGGPYHPHQLELLTILHHTLADTPLLTDILVRTDDSLTYGYQCGETQVFYQERCQSLTGLPTPADLMAVIPLKARRVLERDHSILLL